MSISIRAVSEENWDVVCDLELLKHQEDWLASNSYSIAQASFYPNFHTRAVYKDEEVIGFLMYVSMEEEGEAAGSYAIYRFMVDRRHQGQGHGRAALGLALKEIAARPGAKAISISYKPDNAIAKGFYASFGFVETGIDEVGEMVAMFEL
jgi:diamine N-acetyltransferase